MFRVPIPKPVILIIFGLFTAGAVACCTMMIIDEKNRIRYGCLMASCLLVAESLMLTFFLF